jgi:chromosome segregation ATPase
VHTSTLRERLKGEENMTGIKSGTSSHCVVDDIRGKKRKIHIPPPLETETELERFNENFDRAERIIEHEAKLKEDIDWHAQKLKKAREEMELQGEKLKLQGEKLKLQGEKLKLQREQLEFERERQEFERERQKFERDSKKSA